MCGLNISCYNGESEVDHEQVSVFLDQRIVDPWAVRQFFRRRAGNKPGNIENYIQFDSRISHA